MRGLAVEEAEATLRTAIERHHPSLVMACSFQKEESVLIDMLMGIEPTARWTERRPGSRAFAASSHPPERTRNTWNGTSHAGSGSSIRWSTGATRTCGATCTNTIFPTIPSTTGATLPSDAPPAPCLETVVKDAGPARRRRSAGCTYDRVGNARISSPPT